MNKCKLRVSKTNKEEFNVTNKQKLEIVEEEIKGLESEKFEIQERLRCLEHRKLEIRTDFKIGDIVVNKSGSTKQRAKISQCSHAFPTCWKIQKYNKDGKLSNFQYNIYSYDEKYWEKVIKVTVHSIGGIRDIVNSGVSAVIAIAKLPGHDVDAVKALGYFIEREDNEHYIIWKA